MALNAARQAQVTRSALAIIAESAAAYVRGQRPQRVPSADALYLRLKRIYGQEPGATPQGLRGLAERSLRAAEVGRSIQRRTATAIPANQLPVDTSLANATERIRYDIVVTGYTASGERISFRTEILTNDPMTRDQQTQYAIEHMAQLNVFRRVGSPSVVTDGTQPVPTVTVIAAGRHP